MSFLLNEKARRVAIIESFKNLASQKELLEQELISINTQLADSSEKEKAENELAEIQELIYNTGLEPRQTEDEQIESKQEVNETPSE